MSTAIAVFAFNRPEHLRRALDALAANELAAESPLTVFCDGPRHDNERAATDAVRAVAKATGGFLSMNVICRERNFGCADSIISGLEYMFARHERLIVIEDDILCSPYTLRFLNSALEKYEHEPAVFNIAAWAPPPAVARIPGEYPYDAYFVPRFNCWGWASWRDRWQKIDWAVPGYEEFARHACLQRAFNQGGRDMAPMLAAQMDGRLDTWDIRTDYSRFRHGLVGLNPVYSYTTNIGMGTGTHTLSPTTRLDNDLALALPEPRLPDSVFMDQEILAAYRKAYAPRSLPVRAVNKAWRALFGRNLFIG